MDTNAGICSECDGPATVVLFDRPAILALRHGHTEPVEVPLCQDCADTWYPHADIRPIEEAA